MLKLGKLEYLIPGMYVIVPQEDWEGKPNPHNSGVFEIMSISENSRGPLYRVGRLKNNTHAYFVDVNEKAFYRMWYIDSPEQLCL